ncbi:SIT4 phosphatase-associated family protein isoform 1 [Hibiscus syriacus]|uniref:SIT4 phosphatase-associated family protein isoform 1 n=1 Tax=Hibiscus syriacus TaxID=106335 RepID=A0A6A2Z2F3_HIBSY|nr:SIT4 phosphatase-associated family protein isoform 1 [Hibiscus syriacus]
MKSNNEKERGSSAPKGGPPMQAAESGMRTRLRRPVWDVESGKTERYQWPSEDILKSHGAKDPQGQFKKNSKSVLALAVSSDGRYLASGGLDRHVHLWDTRTRQHLQAFSGHQKPVLFKFSARTSIDCGRDRCMMLFKVLDQSRLVFRPPPTSLECCFFINNDEFLSGSDGGSIQLWNVLRKKPVYVVKNAHALLLAGQNVEQNGSEKIPANGLVPRCLSWAGTPTRKMGTTSGCLGRSCNSAVGGVVRQDKPVQF